MVLVKLQPYRQHSIHGRKNHKLSAKYYGPYKVAAIIGKVSYRLELPATSKSTPYFSCLSSEKGIRTAPNCG